MKSCTLMHTDNNVALSEFSVSFPAFEVSVLWLRLGWVAICIGAGNCCVASFGVSMKCQFCSFHRALQSTLARCMHAHTAWLKQKPIWRNQDGGVDWLVVHLRV